MAQICNRNNNQSHLNYYIMNTDLELRAQEALNAITNGIVQIYDVMAMYGEEVYNAIISMV